MKRRLLKTLLRLLNLFSALLFIAIAVAWARSYHVGDSLSWYGVSESGDEATRRVRTWYSGAGAFAVSSQTTVTNTRGRDGEKRLPLWMRGDVKRGFRWEPVAAVRPSAPPIHGGFRSRFFEYVPHTNTTTSGNTTTQATALTVACWIPALLTGLLPALWLARLPGRRRAARRQRLGLCARCGYDLRASAGRCPECGDAVSVTSAA